MELRWEGEPSLSTALEKLRIQAQVTPPPQWVRIVGGWSEFQFSERRMPTIQEINAAAPETPVFILHLYGRAMLNRAALQVLGITSKTSNPPGGVIERDSAGQPTGMLIAKPSALILYSTLAQGPALSKEHQYNSSRQFMRELNRLGVTSVIDAGGGGQQFPDDYDVINQLHANNELTVRIAYNLFAQKKGEELNDYQNWVEYLNYGDGDDMLRLNGAGENLAWSAADFENFLEPRPDLPVIMESELEDIVSLLVSKRWPFRIHATYDETISRFLNVFEKVDRETPFNGLRFIIDHAETISEHNIARVKALGGGIAVQHRMAFQGEYFIDRYGKDAAKQTPPISKMLEMGVPVGAGTDATRVASYNPWVALYWMVSGNTIGHTQLYDEANLLDRETALYLWTKGSSWFSGEEEVKGSIAPEAYADFAVLSDDFFKMEEAQIPSINSVMTVVGGSIVHGSGDFSSFNPPLPPAMPDWSPVNQFNLPSSGTSKNERPRQFSTHSCCDSACSVHGHNHVIAWQTPLPIDDKSKSAFWGAIGCSCFSI
ncbi:amidohydrolase [Alteromonas gracilis]|uniref:amidohydrolase n=1 Tax=Alteromonas gracilis TaxID=1479524 RepID=UPI00321932F3